ncbi:protein FAR-RED IMPAIRED RESPONSE 1-like [Panicum virgatum]|uniref:FAR1 domain-containing protein n=1 Tax=Panicum virgatum TaxID=38727 RepID=A0A8T0TJX6_PANVG|nr:protein FAR-RED IMPAIRED RESPONSE 1-like [Panicum virgatum]KAG2609425.1 hypothetical protein PVAP13_4KG038200 [Panicum virgatum]
MDLAPQLLPQGTSLIVPPTSPATSSPNFSGIKIPSVHTERMESGTESSKTESASQVENSLEDRIPKIGMKFCTEQEAYDFYNAYARDKGFSIRRSSSHNVKNTTTIKNRTFCCSHAGIRGPDKREENLNYSRPETRCMCQALMKISLKDGLYYIYEFEPEHNHILATASQAHLLRSQRSITTAQLASVEAAKVVSISNKATFDLMAKEVGGNENLGFTHEDMKNKLYSKRSLKIKQGDTGGLMEYLEKKTSEDGKFFYSIQVDEDEYQILCMQQFILARTRFSIF